MENNVNSELSKLKDLLGKLVKIPAPSGYEEPMMRFCRNYFLKFTEKVDIDTRGNLWATFSGTSKNTPKLMLASHMDSIGMIVKSIDEKGFIRFARGSLPLAMCARRVLIHTSKESLLGVIGIRIGYGLSTEQQINTAPERRDMYIDIGCNSMKEVEKIGVKIGDPITFDGDLSSLGNPHYVVSPFLDNRAGIYVLMELANFIKNIKKRPEVVLAATIEEELGLRGASTAAFTIKPDIGISIDTQPAWTPDFEAYELPVEVGKGPVIKFTENALIINHPKVRELLVEAAKKAKVQYQLAAAPPGGSDMGAMEQTGPGIPAAAIGIPRRYGHSPNEVIDTRDLLSVVKIMKKTIELLGHGYSLKRI